MSILIVKPNFNKIKQQLAFPAKSLNYFIESEIQDNFGFYQQNFGIYSYMQLTKNLKYVIHTLTGTPMLWQPLNSCSWDPTGSMTMGRREFEPCRGKINESFCYDEFFDSCFEQFLTYNGRGPVQLDANGIDLVNSMVRTLGQNATLGARLTLTAGQLHDVANLSFNEETSNDIQALFKKTAGTCKGWVELVREMGEIPQYRHMNVPNLLPSTDYNGKTYTGDVIELFDSLKDNATNDMQSLIAEGGIAGSVDGDFMPYMGVTMDIYKAATAQYNEQCISVTCINPRMTREEFQIPTRRGTRKLYVYYIDDVPIIPFPDITYYDRFLTGMTSMAFITVGGNINLGASFAALPDISESNIGILVERATDVKEWGQYSFLAHSLFATTIADHSFFVGSQTYVEPA